MHQSEIAVIDDVAKQYTRVLKQQSKDVPRTRGQAPGVGRQWVRGRLPPGACRLPIEAAGVDPDEMASWQRS